MCVCVYIYIGEHVEGGNLSLSLSLSPSVCMYLTNLMHDPRRQRPDKAMDKPKAVLLQVLCDGGRWETEGEEGLAGAA